MSAVTASDAISFLAFLVSLVALVRTIGKERVKLKTTSKLFLNDIDDESYIRVSATNGGIKTVILLAWLRVSSDDMATRTYLTNDHKGIRLEEDARYEGRIAWSEINGLERQDGCRALCFQDTVGRYYPIEGSIDNIRKMLNEMNRRENLRTPPACP